MRTTINTDLDEDEKKEHKKLILEAKEASQKRKADVKKSLKRKRDYIAADYVDEFLKVCPTLDSDIGHVLAGAEMVLVAVGGEDNINPTRHQFVAAIFKELLIRYYELETKAMRKERIEGRPKRKEEMAATMSQVVSEVMDEIVKRKKDDAKSGQDDRDPMYG